jgi:hypothetical protein
MTREVPKGFTARSECGIWCAVAIFSIGIFAAVDAAGGLAGTRELRVSVRRVSVASDAVYGVLTVDGERIGSTLERKDRLIPIGKYTGKLRYGSTGNRVVGAGGKLGPAGDFLLEIGGVPGRTDILFHAGNRPEHSDGCILVGASGSKDFQPLAPDALVRLRRHFYGTEYPSACPDVTVIVDISGNAR